MKLFTAAALTLSAFVVSTTAAPIASPGGLDDLFGGLGNIVPLGSLTSANVADTESLVSPYLSNPSVESASVTDDTTPAALARRGLLPVDINAIIDVLVKSTSAPTSTLNSTSSPLLTTDTNVVVPKISAKIDSETRVIVNTKIDLDTKAIVLSNIGEHARQVIHKHCPHEDAICISKTAGDIVADVEALVKLDVDRLFIALKTNLMTHVRANLQVLIHELGLNLIVEQIHLQGFVDAVADVDIHLDLCAHIIVKGLHVTVVATAVAAIKSLLGL
ncbi:hypothetical protein BGZ96_010773 [Linnemannia gamsii]|uniref:Uncharacterized protein n=1 Tax=Linnemannia gamsii TaxID=64522 RepID=A0ABQ7KEL7_9FUNG|nr:hypothetical protein BGZ96_010773 [Linnemannia gamsii]